MDIISEGPRSPARPYFEAMQEFSYACAQKQYRRALAALKEELRQTPLAYAWFAESRSWEPRIAAYPGSKAGAIAALFNDEEAFSLMDQTALMLGEKYGGFQSRVPAFREDAAAIQMVRDYLRESSPKTLGAIKDLVGSTVAVRISRLLSWMEKNGEISRTKVGTLSLVHEGVPALRGSIAADTFRDGGQAAVASPFKVRRISHSYSGFRPSPEASGALDERPLDRELRQKTVMATHLLAGGVWLIGGAVTSQDGSSSTHIVTKDLEGNTKAEFDVDAAIVRAFASPARDTIVVLDSLLAVHVFNLDGSQRRYFSLAKNPEFQSVLRQIPERINPVSLVRCVDVCPRSGDVLFSAYDFYFRFSGEGEPRTALRLTSHKSAGEIENFRQAGSALAIPDGQIRRVENRNWVYFARFSDIDDSTYVALYDGQIFKVSPSGAKLDSWRLASAPDSWIEQSDRVIAAGRDISVLQPRGVAKHFLDRGGALVVSPNVFARRVRRIISVFDLGTGLCAGYTLRRDFRAIYPTAGGVRVETTSTFADIDVSRLTVPG